MYHIVSSHCVIDYEIQYPSNQWEEFKQSFEMQPQYHMHACSYVSH